VTREPTIFNNFNHTSGRWKTVEVSDVKSVLLEEE
jgi:hypothetical protein